jgi:penicillin-binding protein 1A
MPDIEATIVALNPTTGGVKAIVGGFDFAANQYNHALQAARQPGSGFKPFLYSAALDAGVTPATIFMDAPLVFEDENLETTYRPKNDGSRFNGPTRLREALYRSINLVSIRVLLQVGAGDVIDYVKRFGFDTSEFPRNTQLAIGGGTMGITPIEMARAYATFANGGFLIEPNILKEVRNLSGETIYKANYPVACDNCAAKPKDVDSDTGDDAPIAAPRVLDERNAFIMNSMLQDVIKRGTAIRARELNRNDLAGKTGTTNEADTWFNGYQKTLVATVWVGFSNHAPVGDNEYGSNGPLPIWMDFMKVALKGVPEDVREQPPGVVTMKIDPRTGDPATPDEQNAIFEYFLAEHVPSGHASNPISADTDTKEPVRPIDIF